MLRPVLEEHASVASAASNGSRLDVPSKQGTLRIQLWSYNYDPEPTGIAPVSRVFAQGLRERGHQVEVVAAHPHYPIARWGVRKTPYRETRHGIPVLRLPLWIGRASTRERYQQELSHPPPKPTAQPRRAIARSGGQRDRFRQ